ncbi:MAG: pentapeptide repeat-containing protein [Solirubrobacterales bacterium]
MAVTIRHRLTGNVLYVAKDAANIRAALEEAVSRRADLRGADLQSADLRRADLQDADLRRAYLRRADLRGAYLQGADLRGAYLRGAHLQDADLRRAYLRGADLRGAYLRGADLRGADGLAPERANDLLLLLDQVGKIRAYKLVNEAGRGPFNGRITYEVGKTYEVPDADTDPLNECGAGINLATLPWCLANHRPGHRVLVCEFTRKDIAAIPISDGKFRVRKVKVVAEKDLSELFERERKREAPAA